METIKGYVSQIIFRNQENGYTVFEMVCGEEEITCVGTLALIGEGENMRASGSFTNHPMYGRQFAVKETEECEPEDETAIEKIGRAHV